MAERPNNARVNSNRRKVTSQLSVSSLPSAPPTSTPLHNASRLKAHINPANIIGGSGSTSPYNASLPPSRPGIVRVPSNVSVRTDTAGRTTPRSEVGGPSAARASPAVGQRPLVARAGARATPPTTTTQRPGAGVSSLPSSTLPSGTSTPTGVYVRRPTSVVGSDSNNNAATPPSRGSPQAEQGALSASTGSRFRAALAGAGASHSDTPSRPVHVRTASFQSGPRSDSSTSHLSTNNSPGLTRQTSSQASGQSSPPRIVRNTSSGSVGVPRRPSNESTSFTPTTTRPATLGAATLPSTSHSPSSSTDIPRVAVMQAALPRLSALAEVTASSENLTQHLATSGPISSSLLSPSTLTPHILPPPPTLEDGALSDHPLEHEPSSNHSSPVRRPLKLGSPQLGSPAPLHSHLAHLGLGSLATASAPTSPRGGNGLGLGLEGGMGARKRAPLPWNPIHGQGPAYPLPPSSPELRTVALPIMTPARTPEQSEYLALRPSSPGSRRFSSSSESGGRAEPSALGIRKSFSPRARVSSETVMRWENGVNGSRREPSSSVGRWSGSTLGDESGDDTDGDDGDVDLDPESDINMNKLEAVVSQDMELERDKWERKIADLEISNTSLMKINMMLETTKVKQQGEIVRLRRALRDARSGALERPVLERASSSFDDVDPDSSGSWGDDEMEDPELEKRWDKLRDLVGSMRKVGEDAVERGRQDIKPHQRVLGWLEVEAMGMGQGSGATTTAASEADPAETVSGATETTDDTSNAGITTETETETDDTSDRSEAAPTEIGLVARVRRFN